LTGLFPVTAVRSGTAVTLTWTARPGFTYEVRYRAVGSTAWTTRRTQVVSPLTIKNVPGVYEFQVHEVGPWNSTSV
jgi:hypothetical protein